MCVPVYFKLARVLLSSHACLYFKQVFPAKMWRFGTPHTVIRYKHPLLSTHLMYLFEGVHCLVIAFDQINHERILASTRWVRGGCTPFLKVERITPTLSKILMKIVATCLIYYNLHYSWFYKIKLENGGNNLLMDLNRRKKCLRLHSRSYGLQIFPVPFSQPQIPLF